MSDGLEVQLLKGLAVLLDSVGIGKYPPDGAVYAASDVGVTFGAFTQDPSEQICLSTYSVQDSVIVNDSVLGVQVQLRGTVDPLSVKNRSGLIFNQFQGLSDDGLSLVLMWRQSGRLDGRDENLRWMSSENYYARVAWPTVNRPD